MSDGTDRDMRYPAEIDKAVPMLAFGLVLSAVLLLFVIGGGMRGFTE